MLVAVAVLIVLAVLVALAVLIAPVAQAIIVLDVHVA